MQKGYVFDIDGTLYNNAYHEVSPRTIQSLKKLQDRNDIVVAATSRATSEWAHLPSSLRLYPFDARIVDGGSLIYDRHMNVLEDHPIDSDVVAWLSRYCQIHNMCWKYSTRKQTYWGTRIITVPMYQVCWQWYMSLPVYKPYEGEEVYNIIVYFNDQKQDEEVSCFVKQMSVIRYFDCIEIRHSGCDKSDAVKSLKSKFCLDHITCFGDGDNDVDMMKIADIGVAMGNAAQSTKQAATYVTDRCDRDGIYTYLAKEK